MITLYPFVMFRCKEKPHYGTHYSVVYASLVVCQFSVWSPGVETALRFPEFGNFDVSAADSEGEGTLDLSDTKGRPDLGIGLLFFVTSDQLLGMCSTTNFWPHMTVFFPIGLAVGGLSCSWHTRLAALQAPQETVNKHIGALESQVATKEARIAVKLAHGDRLEGCLWIGNEWPSLMSTNIHEHGLQLRAAEAAHFSADVALHSGIQGTQTSSCLCVWFITAQDLGQ